MAEKVTIGNCELWHGDCREILPLLPPVDLVLTDPPYGMNAFDGSRTRRMYDMDRKQNWDSCPIDAATILMVLGCASNAIVWGGNYYADVLPVRKSWLSWKKPDAPPTMAQFEMAWTSLEINARQIEQSIAATNAERVGHPSQKPLRVIEWCLNFAPEARTVCDPFMGSGTTGVACARMGLQFVGIERERKYFDIARRRIEQAYAQPRLFEDAKVGAGDTAAQGDMLLPANAELNGTP